MYKRLISIVVIACLIIVQTGCVAIPDAIKSASPVPQQDLLRVMNAPQIYIGQEARFGGEVLNVSNTDGMTRLEIAAMPLDEGARPVQGAISAGRIIAEVKGFLDPVDFNHQMVTVVGIISGTRQGIIDKANYTFVVLSVTGYQRWRRVQQIIMPPQPINPWVWYGAPDGWHGNYLWGAAPGWGLYNPGPARIQTILTE
ncbi:Slp family lipoprotein [Enterobacteriaceae bacterium LUAb1]